MRRFLMMVAVAVFGPGGAWAEGGMSPDPAIENTIQSQFEAFKADDFARAFTFASPNIQGLFGTPDRFGMMVRQGYPMVWRPGDVTYLELREVNGFIWQKVMIQDQNGTLHVLDYQMIQSENGWLINGVQILGAPQLGA